MESHRTLDAGHPAGRVGGLHGGVALAWPHRTRARPAHRHDFATGPYYTFVALPDERGNRTVTVEVADSDGQMATFAWTVPIKAPPPSGGGGGGGDGGDGGDGTTTTVTKEVVPTWMSLLVLALVLLAIFLVAMLLMARQRAHG